MIQAIDIIFVDDVWCRPEKQSIIRADFGVLQQRDPPYIFHYETAEISPGKYGVKAVLEHIHAIPMLGAVIVDVMFGAEGDRLGLEILAAIRQEYPTMPVFIMTVLERGNIDVVERAMELGANEYLVKKPRLEDLENVLRIYTPSSANEATYAIWGNSPGIRGVRAKIARVAVGGTASVLITGESGTGKELVARAIHRQGPRRMGPFIDKNCAHEKSDLLDSDLFGHEKGAFTGADRQHIGRIERASGGVLFLDEIGSMSQELQGKLLRVLETRQFERLGGTQAVTSDFQLICATNDNPSKLLKDGRLREDLFYRIKQFDVDIPPLRERDDDIPILAEFFLKHFKSGQGASYLAEELSKEAVAVLREYPWPGNIRELKNVIERAAILSPETLIKPKYFPPEISRTQHNPESESRLEASQFLYVMNKNPKDWGLQYARMQLDYIARVCENGLARQMKATEIVNSIWPRPADGKVGKSSTEKLKAFLNQIAKPPWGNSEIKKDKECLSLINRIETCIRQMGRKSS